MSVRTATNTIFVRSAHRPSRRRHPHREVMINPQCPVVSPGTLAIDDIDGWNCWVFDHITGRHADYTLAHLTAR